MAGSGDAYADKIIAGRVSQSFGRGVNKLERLCYGCDRHQLLFGRGLLLRGRRCRLAEAEGASHQQTTGRHCDLCQKISETHKYLLLGDELVIHSLLLADPKPKQSHALSLGVVVSQGNRSMLFATPRHFVWLEPLDNCEAFSAEKRLLDLVLANASRLGRTYRQNPAGPEPTSATLSTARLRNPE
jgi:hypothetical protein